MPFLFSQALQIHSAFVMGAPRLTAIPSLCVESATRCTALQQKPFQIILPNASLFLDAVSTALSSTSMHSAADNTRKVKALTYCAQCGAHGGLTTRPSALLRLAEMKSGRSDTNSHSRQRQPPFCPQIVLKWPKIVPKLTQSVL